MRTLIIISILSLLVGCVATNKDYTKFNNAKPSSILIVPAVNRSVEVTAPDYYLSTISIPLAEQGYYVFPVNMVKRLLEDDGLSDADLVHNSPSEKLASLFGADAVLYVVINRWDAQYLLFSTTVTVEIAYTIKSKSGETLWEHLQKMVYTPQNNSSGNPLADLIVMAVSAAATKAAPNYVPLAHQANNATFRYPGPGIPPGPYGKLRISQQNNSTISE
ncbi:MAG: GNA1162 family protein [Thermodesulfobacteriota bacterium]